MFCSTCTFISYKHKYSWLILLNLKRLPLIALNVFLDGQDIQIEGTEKVICGDKAHFQATVKEKKGSNWSITWQKLSRNESQKIDTSNKKFRGKTNKELSIKSVCKEDEGEYQAVLLIEEDRTRKTIQSNVISLRVVGGMILFIRY